jgi:Kef-type K+ transport system membrane component KefB
MIEIHSLLIIAFVAVLAPLLNKLPLLVRIPVIVIELLMGILIGPAGAGWVASGGSSASSESLVSSSFFSRLGSRSTSPSFEECHCASRQ